MSLQTQPTQLDRHTGEPFKVDTKQAQQVPQCIRAHEHISDASTNGYTAAGVVFFSVYPNESGTIVLKTFGDEVAAPYTAIGGVPIIGFFIEIVADGTDIDNIIAFV